MQLQTYAEFSYEIHKQANLERIPVDGTIEVTHRCPLTCAHCYNNLAMGDREARSSELSFAELCRIMDEMAEAGCLWLLFTGGEIFARKDFLDIYTYAKSKGFIITLFTNGTLVTPEIADYLAEYPPFTIEITLYGRTKETYELLTGIPGSFERCLRGINLLRERGLPLNVKTVGVSINKHEVAGMKQFVEEELGLEFKLDAMINPRIDCSQSPLAVRLRPEEVVELDLQDPRRVHEWKRFAEVFTRPAHVPEEMDEVYHCGGGLNAFSIDPQGRMSICLLSHQDTYDLRAGNFREGWEGFLSRVRRKKITRHTKCTDCQIKAMCGMCPANGELENHDPESPVDFLCQVAHLRAHAVGFAVPEHGECEYCPGGEHHSKLMESVAYLTERAGQAMSTKTFNRYLPVINEGKQETVAACSSCSCH